MYASPAIASGIQLLWYLDWAMLVKRRQRVAVTVDEDADYDEEFHWSFHLPTVRRKASARCGEVATVQW